jgi:putative ABC transport system permease protein
MIWQMILRNVLHRPMRTLISVVAVGVEVALVVLVVGLTSGLIQETAKRIEGVGADLMLQPPSASVFMAFSGAPMPIKIREKLLELRHVKAVAPVLLQFNSSGGLDIVYGIEKESFQEVSGGFVFHEGRDLEAPNEILVDDWYARAKNVKVGQTLKLLENEFRVAGIVEHGKGARLFVHIQTLQELSGAREKASVFFVKCTRPEHTASVSEEIRKLFPRHEIRPLKDFLSLMTTSNLPGLNTFINAMIALAVAIGFLVIFLSMYTIIIERTREIGVLKSLGASKGFIVKALLCETGVIVGLGIVVGIGFSFVARQICQGLFPTLVLLITGEWLFKAAVIAVIGGLLGASYPAWMASRKDPVEALAYE